MLSQNDVDLEVVIIDDASPDGSGAVARELAAGDPRVRVIEHEKNAGMIATIHDGLSVVGGEFVVVLSADDMVTPGSFGRSVALLQALPEVSMVYGFAPSFVDTPPPPRLGLRSWSIFQGAQWIKHVCEGGVNPVATPEVMMRTETVRQLGGYDKRVPHACDYLMWLRAAAHGPIGRVNGVDQAFYRVHGQNMSIKQFGAAVTDLSERRLAFEILFDEDGKALPEAERLHDTALRTLACEALVIACRSFRRGPAHADPALAQELATFSVELHPAAQDSRLMREYRRYARRAAQGRGPLMPLKLLALLARVRGIVWWRRWRRSGVLGALS